LGRRAFSVATKRPLAWQPSAMGRPKASDGISRRSTLARSCVRPNDAFSGRFAGAAKRTSGGGSTQARDETPGPAEAMTGH